MDFLKRLIDIQPELITELERTVRIPNPPYMELTVENIGLGPRGLPALSICHYGEQNGDLMRDPEMCFEMQLEDGKVKELHPYYWRNDYVGKETNVIDESTGHVNQRTVAELTAFAAHWSDNLHHQGFLRGYRRTEAQQ